MHTLTIGDRCRVVSKSYRDVLGDVVVVERIVKGKVGNSYHCKHEKTGRVLPFLRHHLELIVPEAPTHGVVEEDEETKALRNFFFPKKPDRCGWCGRVGTVIANKFECPNSDCRNYSGRK
jgi:hypothetical protein